MQSAKDKAKEEIRKLVEKYEKVKGTKEYTEEETKKDFILPLFRALGWNIEDSSEVSAEEATSKGRVDYALKVKGKTKIFIEAKTPKAKLDNFIEQAVGYGYNKKDVSFVVLTNFERLLLFDVTIKPDPKNVYKGLKLDLNWTQYLQRFDKLWLLSKESVVTGELDKLLLEKPKDRLPVDKAILGDLKTWRELLAKNIFRNNTKLFHSGDKEKDASFLKEITQRILNRIIFIRFCEDRELTQRPKLNDIIKERTKNLLRFINEEFKQYNIIFDSDLFSPKDWERDLNVDDKVIKEIIIGTYNPYLFDVIPIDVLGNIYEQYLGYTILLTDHQVRYEEKPEVRKAGGVYYTPEYIVDYIVKNTVGKLLQELPPERIEKLKILDPACGSGSFLIRAYDEMLRYYRNQKDDKKLSIEEKRNILRNHIFGVDIDEQAVEVTKLSLMLKMLEDERGLVFGRELLPMLDRNIKCGNSLISGSPLELKKYFGEDFYKVKPFNWEEEFSEIMKDGGFDVVIGNPPYGAELSNSERKYLDSRFQLNTTDTACLFMALGIELLKNNGAISLIVPKPFVYASNWKKIRERVFDELLEIADCGKVWREVKLEQVIFLLQKGRKSDSYNSCIRKNQSIKCLGKIDKKTFFEFGFYLNGISSDELRIGRKIRNAGAFLNDFVINQRGAVYQKHVIKKPSDFKVLGGKQIGRYFISEDVKGFIPKKVVADEKAFIKENSILAQRIVAHIEHPIDHIKIIASLSKTIKTKEYIIVDTINQLQNKGELSSEFLISILNSKLISWYVYRFICGKAIRTMQFDNPITERIPIPKINLNNKNEKEMHDRLVELVDLMLDLNKKVQNSRGGEREKIQKQIENIDKEIDKLVYRLYNITEEEKKIIEGER